MASTALMMSRSSVSMSTRCQCRPLCGSVDTFCAGLSCITSCCSRTLRLPTLSSQSSKTACSSSKSSCCSRRSRIVKWRCLKYSFNLLYLCCIPFAANRSMEDSLSFASNSRTLSSSQVMEPWIAPHCRCLSEISSFAISDNLKTRNKSYIYGTVVNLGEKETQKKVHVLYGSKDQLLCPDSFTMIVVS